MGCAVIIIIIIIVVIIIIIIFIYPHYVKDIFSLKHLQEKTELHSVSQTM